jgi:death on curing protein
MRETRYLNVVEVMMIYAEVVKASRVRTVDIHNPGGLESALAQPQQTFDGKDLYATLEEKAAALLYSLCQNHPFADGNKRVAFMAARVFLRINGSDLSAESYEAIEMMFEVARGNLSTEKISA